MKTIIMYVDDLKAKFGSDYRTAKELKVTKDAISKIRQRGQCGNPMAKKIAEALNINEDEVLFAAAMARAKISKEALEKFSKNAVLTMNSFMALGVVRPALNHVATTIFEGIKCILCKIVRYGKFLTFGYPFISNNRIIEDDHDRFSFFET